MIRKKKEAHKETRPSHLNFRLFSHSEKCVKKLNNKRVKKSKEQRPKWKTKRKMDRPDFYSQDKQKNK